LYCNKENVWKIICWFLRGWVFGAPRLRSHDRYGVFISSFLFVFSHSHNTNLFCFSFCKLRKETLEVQKTSMLGDIAIYNAVQYIVLYKFITKNPAFRHKSRFHLIVLTNFVFFCCFGQCCQLLTKLFG
jgi:hypothetical protein